MNIDEVSPSRKNFPQFLSLRSDVSIESFHSHRGVLLQRVLEAHFSLLYLVSRLQLNVRQQLAQSTLFKHTVLQLFKWELLKLMDMQIFFPFQGNLQPLNPISSDLVVVLL